MGGPLCWTPIGPEAKGCHQKISNTNTSEFLPRKNSVGHHHVTLLWRLHLVCHYSLLQHDRTFQCSRKWQQQSNIKLPSVFVFNNQMQMLNYRQLMDDLSTNLLNKSIGFSWISKLLRLGVRTTTLYIFLESCHQLK